MRLFDIAEEYKGLYDLAETVETDENGVIIDNSETLQELFNGIEAELSEKAESVAYICKDLKSSADALKEEAKRLTAKAKSLENNEKALKTRLKEALVQSGQSKIKTDKFSFSVSTREVLNYDDVSMAFIDEEFIRTKEELDKTAIKQFYKAGGTVEGLKVSEEEVLSIR